jgi:hypothetical protein
VERHGGVGAVQDVPHVERGEHVQRRQVGDRVGVVEAGPDRDQRASVVPDQREPVRTEMRSDRHDVGGHRALRVRGAVVRGFVAGSIAAEVRAHHQVVGREVGRDVPPHEVGLGKAVQEDDRAAVAADGDVDPRPVRAAQPFCAEAGDGGRHWSSFDRGGAESGCGRSASDQRR